MPRAKKNKDVAIEEIIAPKEKSVAQLAIENALRDTPELITSTAGTPFAYQQPIQDLEPLVESSLPFEGILKDQTEGLMPRSRLADTREAAMREKEIFIRNAIENINARQTGPLDVEASWIPEGYTFMWGRASVNDRPDTTNIRKLGKKGWVLASGDLMPQLAFYDNLSGAQDDSYCPEVDGLIGMLRYKEITEAEDRKLLKASRTQTNSLANNMKRRDNQEINPFLTSQRNQFGNDYTNPFTASGVVGQSIASSMHY